MVVAIGLMNRYIKFYSLTAKMKSQRMCCSFDRVIQVRLGRGDNFEYVKVAVTPGYPVGLDLILGRYQ